MQSMGLIPVLAHPERIEAFQEDPELLRRFLKNGMLSQITSGSVIGFWGEEVKKFTHSLLEQRMAHVMASDTHHSNGGRSPRMDVGLERAADIVGYEVAQAMLLDTPKAILNDEPLDMEPPRRLKNR